MIQPSPNTRRVLAVAGIALYAACLLFFVFVVIPNTENRTYQIPLPGMSERVRPFSQPQGAPPDA